MSKNVIPSFEALPYYMTAFGMAGARFIEGPGGASETSGAAGVKPGDAGGDAGGGDNGDKSGGEGGKQTPAAAGDKSTGDKAGDKTADGFKSQESKDAVMADLLQEREDRKRFQGEAEQLTTANQELANKVTQHEATISERDATISERDTEISVLKLALAHGITESDDISLLSDVADESKREALAKRIAPKNGRSAPVHKSGTGGGDDLNGGSIAEHRREIKARKEQKARG